MKLLQITKMNYKRSKETSKKQSEYYIGIGLCLGVVFGVSMQKKNSNN